MGREQNMARGGRGARGGMDVGAVGGGMRCRGFGDCRWWVLCNAGVFGALSVCGGGEGTWSASASTWRTAVDS